MMDSIRILVITCVLTALACLCHTDDLAKNHLPTLYNSRVPRGGGAALNAGESPSEPRENGDRSITLLSGRALAGTGGAGYTNASSAG